MKSLIKITLIMSLLVPYQAAFAGPMEEAQRQVQASMTEASGVAAKLVELDRQFAFRQAVAEMANAPDAQALGSQLLTEQKKLGDAFQSIASIDLQKITDLRKLAKDTYVQLGEASRTRFADSFIRAQATADLNQALHFTTRALAGFESECQVGHSTADFNASPEFLKRLPPPDFFIRLYMDDKSGQFSAQMGAIATDDQTESFLNKAANTSLQISSTAYSVGFSAAASPAVVSVAMAAAPWTLGVGIALGVAAAVIAHQNELEMQSQIVQANTYLFLNMADADKVAMYYRQTCVATSKDFEKIRLALTDIESHPESKKIWTDKVIQNSVAIDQWLNDVQALNSFEKNADPTQVGAAKTLQQKVIAETSSEIVTLYLVRVLTSNMDSMDQSFANITWDNVDKLQAQAFQKLLQIVDLLQIQLNKDTWSKDSALMKEEAIEQDFVNLKAEFQQVLALEIKQIFGREDLSVVNAAEAKLLQRVTSFNEKYAFIPSVRDLFEQTKNLVRK